MGTSGGVSQGCRLEVSLQVAGGAQPREKQRFFPTLQRRLLPGAGGRETFTHTDHGKRQESQQLAQNPVSGNRLLEPSV